MISRFRRSFIQPDQLFLLIVVYGFNLLLTMLGVFLLRSFRFRAIQILTKFSFLIAFAIFFYQTSSAQVLNPAQAGVIESGYGITPNLIGAADVFVQGNYAYVVGSGDALEVIDITLPGLPVHKGILYNGVGGASILQPRSIVVQGKYAYITSFGGSALEIVDVSNPAQPIHKGIAKNIPRCGQLHVSDGYAYIICGSRGYQGSLQIVDVSNPAAPILKGSLADGGGNAPFIAGFEDSPFSIYVSGNYAYIGSLSGLEIVDVSDPSNPLHKGALQGSFGSYSVYATENFAYIGGDGGLTIIDVTDRANPILKGSYAGPGPVNGDIYISGNYAYLGDASIIDISNPASPSLAGSISGFTGRRLSAAGHFLYVVGGNNYTAGTISSSTSLTILDVSNPSSPAIKSVLKNGSSSGPLLDGASSVYTSGNYAYVISKGNNSLEIIDVSNPAVPTHKSSLVNGSGGALLNKPTSIFVSGNYAFITCSGSHALEIVDVSNPSLPTHKGSITDLSGGASLNTPEGVYVLGNYAYITDSFNSALEIVDISNASTPVHAGKLTDGGGSAPFLLSAGSIYVAGTNAYILNYYGLEIVDISNPETPMHKGSLSTASIGGAPNLVTVSGTYAYLATSQAYLSVLQIVNVSDPSNPALTGHLECTDPSLPPYISSPVGIFVSGNSAIVATASESSKTFGLLPGGLVVIDISDPTNPVYQASLLNGTEGALIDEPTSLFVSGSYAYLTNSGAYQDLNIINLYGPTITDFAPSSGNAGSSVTISGQNFNTFITASIGGVPAEVTSVEETSVVVTVPATAVNGKIGLNYNGLALTSANNFLVIPGASAASAIKQTTFDANWSNVGAAGYFLDVSTDNFQTFVGSYNNFKTGNVNSISVTGLAAGTTYQYRVRSSDGVNASTNSDTVRLLTLPAVPTPSLTSVTQNTFTANWPSVFGASGYYIDVAADSTFSSNLQLYNNLLISTTSQVVSGLAPGTTYYFRVKANNAGGNSSSSKKVSVSTIPLTPTAQVATNVSTSGFTANWSAVTGASNYYLDVSSDNFITFVSGYDSLSTSAAGSLSVTGLNPGIAYQYRVRSGNSSGVSGNSNVMSVLILTPVPSGQPTNMMFSNAAATAVTISFSQAQGNPSGYIALRSTAAQPSVTPVNGVIYTPGSSLGNSTVAYVGSALSFFDGGLPTGTTYNYFVYSYNGTNTTVVYLTSSPLQGTVTLDVTPPVINSPSNPNPTTITNGNTPIFNVVITDNVAVGSAQIFYRGISRGSFKSAALNPSGFGDNYSVQIQTTWYDSLGMEYYFVATDKSGNTTAKPSSTNYVQLINQSISLPPLPSGSGQNDYRIVSFPYQLATDNKVTTVYSGVPWNDNTKAALWWWDPTQKNGSGDYDQYGVSPTLQTVDIGKGYWMITSTAVTPQLTNIAASKFNRNNLYTMTLKPGWNQVGNPYPVPISWDDVIKLNPSASFSALSVFDGTGYSNATGSRLLKAFEGGFVKNLGSSDISIVIPFAGQTSIGGREGVIDTDLSSDSWNVFLYLSQNDLTNKLGGFGMHPQAISGADRYDNFNPPKFLDNPEINFFNDDHPEIKFSNEMVNTVSDFVWHFVPDGKLGKTAQLTWPKINNHDKQLFLFDEEMVQAIDMTTVNSYSFALSPSSKFSIYYGSDVLNKLSSKNITVSAPYPNPVINEGNSTFNISLPESSDYKVELSLIDIYGKSVGEIQKNFSAGFQQLDFALSPSLQAGIYIYRLSVVSEKSSRVFTGKIVKP